jgi:hypothetical protein
MNDGTGPETPDQGSSFIVRKRDYADICQLQKATVAEQFLEEPITVIAESISGWLKLGTKETMLAVPRVALAALKGSAFEQFGREFDNLRKSGRIPDNHAEKKYGYSSLAELLAEIDSNPNDEDRLETLKAMFYSVNKVSATDGERVAAYQLFQLAKKLTGGQLLLLRAAELRFRSPDFKPISSTRDWLGGVANLLGHGIIALVEQDEKVLMENNLLSGRQFSDGSGVSDSNGRLTDFSS